MDKLKIVMTTTFYPPYHLGGDAIHVYYLSNELAKLGHEVHIIHSIDSYRWQRKDEPKYQYPNHKNIFVYPLRSPIGKLSPLISYIFGSPFPLAKEIVDLIDKIQPDVLHHHNIAGFGPFILQIEAPIVLYTAHDYWLVCPMSGLTRHDKKHCNSKSNCSVCSLRSKRPIQIWRYSGILEKYLENVDIIITPSNFMKNTLQQFGVHSNFVTLYNFVPKAPEIGNPLHNYPYILFVGVIEEHKGILNLMHAYIGAKNKIDEKLLIVGAGSLENKIGHIIIENKLDDNILLLGKVDDVTLANLYKNALAVIIPSIWPENCPLVALESLSTGTPIIVSNKGGLPELIRDDAFNGVVMNDINSHELLRSLDLVKRKPKGTMKFNNTSEYYIQALYKLIGKEAI